MRAVIQRVSRAEVRVDGESVSSIGPGLAVLVGVADGDSLDDAEVLADKVVGLRVFPDGAGKMNLSAVEAGGSVLVVSQFTLHGDLRRGRRPSFTAAADPAIAEPLIDALVARVGRSVPVESGRFGASMQLDLVNDGPVTIILEIVDGRVI
ncbi:MAG: D-tyrosyl-tRNA(Tyr) deacylase [Acidimicrobiia bacterium]|jgi:D-tyrosyl-tRNA(Tyr) deacylase|nr:D-tyrosyl-tRNA(Tyr) deacylase [Acidimicrobiia bacterium]